MDHFNILSSDKSIFSIDEIVTNKYIDVHTALYNIALSKYIESLHISEKEFFDKYIVTESKNSLYYLPSKIFLCAKDGSTDENITVELNDFWPEYNWEKFKDDEIIEDPIDGEFAEDKLIEIDFARGNATMFNKYSNKERKIKLANINNRTPIDESIYLNDSFTKLYKIQTK